MKRSLSGDGSSEQRPAGHRGEVVRPVSATGENRPADAPLDGAALRAELSEARNELARRAAELADASEARTRFLATMSHELRTPLNAVLGYAGLLRDGVYGQLSPEQARAVHAIIRRTHDLQLMIDDVLDLSRLETGRAELRLGSFDPAAVVNEVRDAIAGAAAEKSLSVVVRYDLRRSVRGDRARYKHILASLASNAVKFTPPHGEVEIALGQGGHDTFITRVRDTGIGIPPDQMGLIFDDFRQLDTGPTRRYAGIGVGLALARRGAELMAGSVTVESAPQEGTTVLVRLPLAAGESVSAEMVEEPPKDVDPGATLVLVIDDDPEVISLLRESLASDGFRVVGALTGDRGIELAHMLDPFAIILDIMMPGKDGWQVLRELKRDRTLQHVPVIVMSIVSERALGFSLGAADYLVKPVDRRVLLDVLRRLREEHTMRSALVLEADDDGRTQLCDLLRSLDHSTRSARTVDQALALLREEAPDVLFLDTGLPNSGVQQVLGALASEEALGGVSVVLLTHGRHERPPLPPGVESTLLDAQAERPDELLDKLRDALASLAMSR